MHSAFDSDAAAAATSVVVVRLSVTSAAIGVEADSAAPGGKQAVTTEVVHVP